MAKELGVTADNPYAFSESEKRYRLFKLTKRLNSIKAEKELIEKNQFSGVKADGTRYNFLEKKDRLIENLKKK